MNNHVDHVMIDSRKTRCVLDVQSCSGVSGIPDHFLVRVKMRIRLSISWRTKKTIIKKFDIEKPKEQTDKIAYIESVDKLNERIENYTEVGN